TPIPTPNTPNFGCIRCRLRCRYRCILHLHLHLHPTYTPNFGYIRFPSEYCDDCGTPLFADPSGELVHPEMPEDTPAGGTHFH
ncbi:MAG: DUF2863 family protein, partial [Burkholderiales bacterium]|nr:DUF2863 family protein [Burkholderiales bacterium]